MEEIENNNSNSGVENKKEEKLDNEMNLSNKKKDFKMNVNISNEKDEDLSLYYNQKRSHSCIINEPKNKCFEYNNDEIKLNLNKKLLYLKTPQLKPKKSSLIPQPINLGSIPFCAKKSKYGINEGNIIVSEGEEEESNEYSSDSDISIEYAEKENSKYKSNEIEYLVENNNKDLNNTNNNINIKEVKPFQIEEENDEYDKNGNLELKKFRRNMIQSKKLISKDIKNVNKFENLLMERYKKYKEFILKDNVGEETPQYLYNSTGFRPSLQDKELPILDFLRKNSFKIKNK